MTAQPKFIVVEGLEGAGKSTAIAHIKSWLAARGITPVCTREPGGTPLAEKLRDLVKQVRDNEQVAAETELLLMYAARMQLITNVIKPALAAGHWVLADRHDMSSRAYQGGGRGLSDDMINPLRAMVLGDLQPDLTLYLDIDPALGLQRARMRGELDRIEQEQLAFFQRTRDKYRQIASNEANIAVIDANQPLAQVQQQISAALDRALA
ncbi:MAG: dTMP kinase [Gammaproteobacteria bacterium]|nr:dTMP kinase [Gammaproteobacteria bacterium]MBU1554716.1 dTMP kinase [Gammaproteobacteria bacterium]MBU2070139.1 dTMP kinase [Gammaproteobacteria bacterium]MBU2181890.1 dTMP kinase [Gammaproteobacteria bacterium]MBU2205416.1 dTMP kinase [Gammaproteobacteria bacterium]